MTLDSMISLAAVLIYALAIGHVSILVLKKDHCPRKVKRSSHEKGAR